MAIGENVKKKTKLVIECGLPMHRMEEKKIASTVA